MKKFLSTLLALSFCFFTACGNPNKNSSGTTSDTRSSDSVLSSQDSEPEHEHFVTYITSNDPTCSREGNVAFYFCLGCNGYFSDENATVATSYEATRKPMLPHNTTKVDGYVATCDAEGLKEHWLCSVCGNAFADEGCTEQLASSQLGIPKRAHQNMVHKEGFPVDGDKNGEKEHWYCEDCDGYFLSADGTNVVDMEDIILYSAVNIPDFMIEIPEGRDPVVLQLTDTQMIDGSQYRPGEASSGDAITYAPSKFNEYCYDYLTEIITKTKPDLIIITGDLIYGKYDDNGSLFTSFVTFMDTFQIPWAPIFGNHEGESKMGVDWQCEQLKNAKYCLFEQKELTGNGNYSVGIMQGGKIKRVFYMLDTNGCSNASEETMQNGHTSKSAGFGPDQIEWYTNQITQLKEVSPDTKISFAYHIQQAVFGEALEKYGFDQTEKYQDIFIEYAENHSDGDFGYLGRQMKDPWDASKTIYEGMKKLGVDSIFVGHEHCNSASVVYEGIRFQYGQKSSEYDRYNAVTDEGEIVAIQIWNKVGTPLVGGSVIVLSETDGSIKDSYIYYCENAGGNINWDDLA